RLERVRHNRQSPALPCCSTIPHLSPRQNWRKPESGRSPPGSLQRTIIPGEFRGPRFPLRELAPGTAGFATRTIRSSAAVAGLYRRNRRG
ncbi:unknown, partial [Alces alces papillomavirus 1]